MKYFGAALPWILAVIMGFLFLGQCGKDAPAIPPELEATSDSLRATRAAFDSLQGHNSRLADSVGALAASLRASTRPVRVTSIEKGVSADSAALLAHKAKTLEDSANAWRLAYEKRTEQALALETVVAKLDSAAVQDSIVASTLRRSLTETSQRLIVAEGLANDLREAAETKSRWSWLNRIGVSAGYGITATMDGQFTHGLQVTAGVKLWP